MKRSAAARTVLTVGHSTHPLPRFIALLRAHGVERIVDVRTIPRSRHNPQFNREAFAAALRAAGIGYVHLKKLGGLRHARPDSVNLGWRNASFRGFADYMQSSEFEAGLARLLKLAKKKTSAMMCAEAVPWHCHRSLIADALLVRRVRVEHILSGMRRRVHSFTPCARVRGTQITYPASDKSAVPPTKSKESSSMIQIERVYGSQKAGDKARYLVERLWPRGMKKNSLNLDAWLKDVAPSDALRRWFGHKPERWQEFRRRYLAELRAKPETWKPILEAAQRGNVALLYSARDTEHNGALVLEEFLTNKLRGK